jgi:hypothetical protein
MRLEDLAAHVSFLGPLVADQHVVFIGDSDGVVLGLACAAVRGDVPAPAGLTLFDFDQRVLHWIKRRSRRFGFEHLISAELYNVFDPLPHGLAESGDFFHTNPPYGQYNGGRSVIAFAERAIAATRTGGRGLVILANDPAYAWTAEVLNAVLSSLRPRLTIEAVLARCHGYHLDDQPDLQSGIVLCSNVRPDLAMGPLSPLPETYVERFYGRETIPIPRFISLEGDPQLALAI